MATRDTLDLLIVDDDEELNALLTEYFQGFGHTLRSATTAAAGHQQLRRALPDPVSYTHLTLPTILRV